MKNYYNALTFDENILTKSGANECTKINFVGRALRGGIDNFEKITHYIPIEQADENSPYIYLFDLQDYDLSDKAIELTHRGAKLMISCSETLDEVGRCDKKFGVTPIGLLHKLGLLENALLAGCVWLDRDDIDLIVQSNAEIILTPSTSMGNGSGIPPVRMLLSLGATVRLGSGQPIYNHSADMSFESKLIALASSGALCTKDAVTFDIAEKLLIIN